MPSRVRLYQEIGEENTKIGENNNSLFRGILFHRIPGCYFVVVVLSVSYKIEPLMFVLVYTFPLNSFFCFNGLTRKTFKHTNTIHNIVVHELFIGIMVILGKPNRKNLQDLRVNRKELRLAYKKYYYYLSHLDDVSERINERVLTRSMSKVLLPLKEKYTLKFREANHDVSWYEYVIEIYEHL